NPVFWRKFTGINPVLKILASRGEELSFYNEKINTSPLGLHVFVQAFKINGNLKNLTELNLGKNNIGASGAQVLANGNLMNLTELNLVGNYVGSSGAQALAQGNLSNLTELYLRGNNIGDLGAQALGQGKLTNLTLLDLGGNN